MKMMKINKILFVKKKEAENKQIAKPKPII
jgi:hypothetical protein